MKLTCFKSLIVVVGTMHSASVLAVAPATSSITLVATVPNACSLQVINTLDSLSLGQAVQTQSLQRFQIPVNVKCNTPNAKLRALPFALTSSSAPGYSIYYHLNTDVGISSGLGWINTSFDQSIVMAQFPTPVSQEIMFYLEGFRESSGRTLPAGNYSGYVQLTIGAD